MHGMAARGEIVFHEPHCSMELRNCDGIDHARCRSEFRNCDTFPTAQLAPHFEAWNLEYLLTTVK